MFLDLLRFGTKMAGKNAPAAPHKGILTELKKNIVFVEQLLFSEQKQNRSALDPHPAAPTPR